MATVTTFLGGQTTSTPAIPAAGLNKVYVLRNRLDFSDTNTAASDVVNALVIPANTYVIDVLTKVVTAEGGALTATVGDLSGANSWDAQTDLNGSVGTWTQSTVGTDAYAASAARGKVYSSATYISLTMSAAIADAAVMDVIAICVDLNA